MVARVSVDVGATAPVVGSAAGRADIIAEH